MKKTEKKYIAIAELLRARLLSGEEEQLPGENALADAFGVSRSTIRQALLRLESEGIIERGQGKSARVSSALFRYHKPRFRKIGMITWDMQEYVFDPLVEACRDYLLGRGYRLEVLRVKASFELKRAALEDFLRKDIDGLIIEGMLTALPTPNADLYAAFREKGVPIVQLNGAHAELSAPYIITDDRKAVAEIIDHLAAMGHEKIGAIFNPTEEQSLRRYQGYTDGLRRNGLTYRDARVLFINMDEFEYLFDALFYARQQDLFQCTAIVCVNDLAARYFEATLKRAGVDVPEQITVTGFDDAFPPKPGQSEITTAVYPSRAIGEAAAEMMLEMLESGRDVPSRVFDVPVKRSALDRLSAERGSIAE